MRFDDSPVTECSDIKAQFDAEGRVWLRNAISPDTLATLRELSDAKGEPGVRLSNQGDLVQVLKQSPMERQLGAILPGVRPVRIVSFDKSPSANWSVPWHQDRMIAVKEKADVQDFKNWSKKAGIWHCEPPREILESMLFVRIHLDSCTADDGAMDAALGSHRAGIVDAEAAADFASRFPLETTTAEAGDVLILHMLTLHRSKRSSAQSNRRVLRMDYAADALPPPLEWF